MLVRHSCVGRPDHSGYIAASRNRGHWVWLHWTNPRHQLIYHLDRKLRCTTGVFAAHHCFVRLICLPFRSILPLGLGFFGEIGCLTSYGGAADGCVRARKKALFKLVVWSRLVSWSSPPAANADR